MHLSETLKEKWPLDKQRQDQAILLHNNTWLNVAKAKKTYLKMFKWGLLPQLPYPPDIALLIITYSVQWYMDWRSNVFIFKKILKNRSLLG